jgi:tol-pal system beta propeller repeat protein TolB
MMESACLRWTRRSAVAVRLLVTMAASFLLALVMAPAASQATFPGDNGKLVFASNERLFTIDPDGSNLTRIPTTSCEGLEPDWAPDGRRIGFIERCGPSGSFDISVVNVDGTGLKRLYASNRDDARIDWSPDGSKFLFISDQSGNREIYLRDALAGRLTRLTRHPATDDWPAWSPDGRRIAFTSNRSGNFDLYTMNADGTGKAKLTTSPANDGDFGGPSWSPDGRKIAFDSLRTGQFEIFSLNLQPRAVSQLTSGGTNLAPAWSPDGRLIAFTSDRTGDRELFLMTASGTFERRLAPIPGPDQRPDWQVIPKDGDDG